MKPAVLSRATETFTLRRVLVLKAVIAIGILAGHFLPPEQAIVVSIASNLLWLVAF